MFDVQLQRAFVDQLVALGASSEETKKVLAQAFVQLNGAELKRYKGRQKIGMEYDDLPEVLVVRRRLEALVMRRRLQDRTRTTGARHCRCDL